MKKIPWEDVFVSAAHLRTLKGTNTFSNTSVFWGPNFCTPPNDICISTEVSLFRKHGTCWEKVADTLIIFIEGWSKCPSCCGCIQNGNDRHTRFCICSKMWPTKGFDVLKRKYIFWACIALLICRDLLHHSILWIGSTVCYGWILFQRAGQENNLQA